MIKRCKSINGSAGNSGYWVCLVLLLASLIFAGCSESSVSPAQSTVTRFYQATIDTGATGAPSPKELAVMAPYLSTELQRLLFEARALRKSEARAHPDEKPPFADGDLFSSLFEGPTRVVGVSEVEGAGERVLAVEFADENTDPPFNWTDRVALTEENRQPVIADVIYGGDWPFATHGSLRANLEAALADAVEQPPWVLRFDGIGPVRVGMSVAEAEALLGGGLHIERVEEGEACGQAGSTELPDGVSLMVDGNTIVRVDVGTSGILSMDGIGVGDDETGVLARLGPRLRVESHPYEGPEGHNLVLDATGAQGLRMIFQTDGQVITRYRSGRQPEVDFIEGCL